MYYYLCEKSYKPITILYYIVNCVNWVPRLTCWTYKRALRMELVCMYEQ